MINMITFVIMVTLITIIFRYHPLTLYLHIHLASLLQFFVTNTNKDPYSSREEFQSFLISTVKESGVPQQSEIFMWKECKILSNGGIFNLRLDESIE